VATCQVEKEAVGDTLASDSHRAPARGALRRFAPVARAPGALDGAEARRPSPLRCGEEGGPHEGATEALGRRAEGGTDTGTPGTVTGRLEPEAGVTRAYRTGVDFQK